MKEIYTEKGYNVVHTEASGYGLYFKIGRDSTIIGKEGIIQIIEEGLKELLLLDKRELK